MQGNCRQLVKIIKEICQEKNISFQGFSNDWILKLQANHRTMYVHGYKFPNNNAAVEHICTDKAALSDILTSFGIPHIPHHFFASPGDPIYLSPEGNWAAMRALLQKYGKIVCKPNTGTGGNNVIKVSTSRDLEYAAHTIFSKSRAMSISPYREIRAEYRIIVVDSIVATVYEKKRPCVIGNGVDTIRALYDKDASLAEIQLDPEIDISRIPSPNETVEISWKHNLGQGAHPVIISDPAKKNPLVELALSCVVALDAEFMSIDIVEDENGLEILEINSGVMMENLAKSSPQNYALAKTIYEKAIFHYLGLDTPKGQYILQKPQVSHFVLPVLSEIARERNVQIIPDAEEGNFAIFVFKNGNRFVARDYPFNINFAGSISLCTNKAACASFLQRMGFHVPKQKYFVKKSKLDVTLTELERYFYSPEESLGFGFPMIVKPNGLSQGTGVYKVFNPADGMRAALNALSLKEKLFLLQEYCPGRDYRIVVLNHQVIQAYERIPFCVVGNGTDTIDTLLRQKARDFELAGRDKKIDIHDERIMRNILSQGYTPLTILGGGVVCQLQDIANLSLGGTTKDITDLITPYYADLAIKIADSLNLKLCGIDIIAEDITEKNHTDYSILEVNSAPGLDNYVFEGEKQDEYVKGLYGKVFDYIESISS